MKKNITNSKRITNKKINNFIADVNKNDDNNTLEDIVYNFLESSSIDNKNTKNNRERIVKTLIQLAGDGDIKAIKEILSLEQRLHTRKKENKEYMVNIEFTSVADSDENTQN